MSRLSLLGCLALSACTGSVKLTELDSFGGIASAEWMHTELSSGRGGDVLVLSNEGGYCKKYQTFWDTYSVFMDAGSSVSPMSDTYCEELEEPTLDFLQAADDLTHAGVNLLSMNVHSGGGDSVPSEGSYDAAGGDRGLNVSIEYFTTDTYGDAVKSYDPEGTVTNLCGLDQRAFDGPGGDTYVMTDGTLDVSNLTAEKSLKGELEGTLVDEDGQPAGDLSASFTASYCVITME